MRRIGLLTVMLVCIAGVACADVDQETATAAVGYLAESYPALGHERLIGEIKELRQRLGKRYVFSMIQVEGAQAGKVLYHPVPFVTGRNVTTASDADGHTHGADALRQAQRLPNRSGLWLGYTIRSPLTNEREERFMFCERIMDRMLCCSFPNSNQQRLPSSPVPAGPYLANHPVPGSTSKPVGRGFPGTAGR